MHSPFVNSIEGIRYRRKKLIEMLSFAEKLTSQGFYGKQADDWEHYQGKKPKQVEEQV